MEKTAFIDSNGEEINLAEYEVVQVIRGGVIESLYATDKNLSVYTHAPELCAPEVNDKFDLALDVCVNGDSNDPEDSGIFWPI